MKSVFSFFLCFFSQDTLTTINLNLGDKIVQDTATLKCFLKANKPQSCNIYTFY